MGGEGRKGERYKEKTIGGEGGGKIEKMRGRRGGRGKKEKERGEA